MNKKTIFILLLCFFFICGCSNKMQSISVEDFHKVVQAYDYNYIDASRQFEEVENIVSVSMASTNVWHIEFYVLNSQDSAIELYDVNQHSFLQAKTSTSYETEDHGKNFHQYSLTTSHYFMYLCQIDDTLLYARVPVEYRNKVSKLIHNLGY